MEQLLQVWVVAQEVEGLDLIANMAWDQLLPVISAWQQEVNGVNEEMWSAPQQAWRCVSGLPPILKGAEKGVLDSHFAKCEV